MDRKKTILIAILINAGLLVLLFIAALHHKEEPVTIANNVVESASLKKEPLFNGEASLAQAPFGTTENRADPMASPVSVLSPLPVAPPAPTELVHQLPPLAPQEAVPVAPMPVSVASAPAVISTAQQAIEVKVAKGDTLEKIAKRHRTTVDEIIKFNQLPSSFLRIGQVLKLPAERTLAQTAKKPIAAERASGAQGQVAEYYLVKAGDNPWTIAKKHNMKVDELLKMNGLTSEKAKRLKPGDRLRVK